MTDISPAEELHAAAKKAQAVGDPLHTALAQWLTYEADLVKLVPGSEMKGRTKHALAVAQHIPLAPPEGSRLRPLECGLWMLSRGHIAHNWQPQPGMPLVYCPGHPVTPVAIEEPQ